MGRRKRCLLANQLVEVTNRTIQGLYLLQPSSKVNECVKGILGRAQRYTELPLVAHIFMGNHFQLLAVPESEKQLSDFMRFVNTNLSKQLGRIHGWSGPMWQRRYQAIPVTDEEDAQIARLSYILEHGMKEDLVETPRDWPGVHCIDELSAGRRHQHGIWHERTKIWQAKQRGIELSRNERITRETVELSPLPVWAGLTWKQRRNNVRELLAFNEDRHRARRRRESVRVPPIHVIERQDPHGRPERSKSSPAPLVHASSVEAWLAWKRRLREFDALYQPASAAYRRGEPAEFPPGCFAPRGPYIPPDGPPRAGPG